MSYFTQISYSDSGSLDAFTRLRVSQPETIFATQCQYNAASLQMEAGATGAGTTPAHDANTRMVALVSTGVGTSFFQSYQYSPYFPGKSQLIAITGVLGAGVAGATVDTGYFDASNGVIFRQNGVTNLQLILRTSTSGVVSDSNIVAQSAWSLDHMDGTGASGITLDVTKTQILIIDLQFLGVGRVRVGFDIGGVIYYVHEFKNANVLAVPYMQTATLPIGMLVTTTVGAKTAHFKCATVISEGGRVLDSGFRFTTPEVSTTAASGARTHLMSVRPKTTFNGLTNRELFIGKGIQILNTGGNPIRWELIIGATFSAAPTYADVDATYSAFEASTTAGTYTASTGSVIAAGYLSAASGAATQNVIYDIETETTLHYPISLNRAGAVRNNGTLSLFVTGIGGVSACRGAVSYLEIR